MARKTRSTTFKAAETTAPVTADADTPPASPEKRPRATEDGEIRTPPKRAREESAATEAEPEVSDMMDVEAPKDSVFVLTEEHGLLEIDSESFARCFFFLRHRVRFVIDEKIRADVLLHVVLSKWAMELQTAIFQMCTPRVLFEDLFGSLVGADEKDRFCRCISTALTGFMERHREIFLDGGYFDVIIESFRRQGHSIFTEEIWADVLRVLGDDVQGGHALELLRVISDAPMRFSRSFPSSLVKKILGLIDWEAIGEPELYFQLYGTPFGNFWEQLIEERSKDRNDSYNGFLWETPGDKTILENSSLFEMISPHSKEICNLRGFLEMSKIASPEARMATRGGRTPIATLEEAIARRGRRYPNIASAEYQDLIKQIREVYASDAPISDAVPEPEAAPTPPSSPPPEGTPTAY